MGAVRLRLVPTLHWGWADCAAPAVQQVHAACSAGRRRDVMVCRHAWHARHGCTCGMAWHGVTRCALCSEANAAYPAALMLILWTHCPPRCAVPLWPLVMALLGRPGCLHACMMITTCARTLMAALGQVREGQAATSQVWLTCVW